MLIHPPPHLKHTLAHTHTSRIHTQPNTHTHTSLPHIHSHSHTYMHTRIQVAMVIDIREILHQNPDQAVNTISEAINVLNMWYDTYLKVRQKIEDSGTDHRWEFDRKRLFEHTKHMAKICEDLKEVAVVLDQFQKVRIFFPLFFCFEPRF